MKIYEALYCPCIHESSFYTLSTHRTKEGAEKAIENHRLKILGAMVYESIKELEEYEAWKVNETKLLD